MKNRFMFGIFIVTLMIFSSCANDDQATVTINLIRNDMAFNNKEIKKEYSIIDKFISFIFMTSDVHAKWSADHTAAFSTLSLKITGDDMSDITAQLPEGAASYTFQVPAGANRKFILINTTTQNSVPKNWGGSVIVNLAPGDSVNLIINMIPMTVITSLAPSTGGNMSVSWDIAASSSWPASVISARIYRSDKPEGPYFILQTVAFTSSPYPHSGLTPGKTYYYKVSIISTYGEGVLSDYAFATAN
jgi:hypothetical protein